MSDKTSLVDKIKRLPQASGVYLFKNESGEIIYIGKAKNLRLRVSQYLSSLDHSLKTKLILDDSVDVEFETTDNEVSAMLLEAKLIQSHQPRYNVLLKTGQPFLYLMITLDKLPELKLVRNKRKKGTYFGPFIEKGPARKVFSFLEKTFKLKLCKQKIEQGCLYYHMGICSGFCRPDFDERGYRERLELARKALQQGHKKFLQTLLDEIARENKNLNFEKSRELYTYYQAFDRVFESLDTKPTDVEWVGKKAIWAFTSDQRALYVFEEQANVLKEKYVFYFPFSEPEEGLLSERAWEYLESVYRTIRPPVLILTNFTVDESRLETFKQFLKLWHDMTLPDIIAQPRGGHYERLVRLASVQADEKFKKKMSLGKALQMLLKLSKQPQTIDCFDISHKQGIWMTGSCVRFSDGMPDKDKFRRFKIRTVEGQDDYASLREIVQRRYGFEHDLPDVILIDGGKGQLNAVQDLYPQAVFVSLAKREETIFSRSFPQGKVLDQTNYAAHIIIALRDYAHHFALSYHHVLEKKDLGR